MNGRHIIVQQFIYIYNVYTHIKIHCNFFCKNFVQQNIKEDMIDNYNKNVNVGKDNDGFGCEVK